MIVSRAPAPSLGWAVLGYAAGVVAATFALEAYGAAQQALASRLVAGSVASLVRDTIALSIVVAVATALPCLVAECLARLLGIRFAWWFALWGAGAGLATGPVTVALPDIAGSYGRALWEYGACFAFGGAVGGLAYWWVSGLARSRARRRLP